MSVNTMKASVNRSIDRYGEEIETVRLTTTGVDLDTGRNIESETRTKLDAILTNFSREEIAKGVVNIDDMKAVIAGSADLEKGDFIDVGDLRYTLMDYQTLRRSGENVRTVMVLRKLGKKPVLHSGFSDGFSDGFG